MLYIFDEVHGLDDDFYAYAVPHLSEERINKINKLKSPLHKSLSAVAYLLLRYALVAKYGLDEKVLFGYGKNEKPYLRDYPNIHFNLSHTANAVACAVSGLPIGVDVQRVSEVSDSVAKRILSAREYGVYLSANKSGDYFSRIWAIKESVLKQTGQGISGDFRSLSADELSEITVYKGDGYYCCVTRADAIAKKVGFEELRYWR